MNQVRVKVAAAALALLAAAGACSGDDGETEASGPETTSGPSGSSDTTVAAGPSGDALGPADAASGEPIRIGMIADGRTAATDNRVEFDAAHATVEFLNQHRGGIGGRPIELVTCDSQLDPALTTDCANQMVQEGVPVVIQGTQANQEQSWQVLHGAGIPMLWGATNQESVLTDADTSFVMFNAEAALIDLPIAVAEENDLDKVTVLVVDVPAALGTWNPIPPEFEEAGIEVEVIPVPIGTADMTAPLQSLAGVSDSVVHIIGFDAFCISAFNAFQALGFTGPVSANSLCVTEVTRTSVPADQLEGVAIASGVPVDVEDESTALYRAVVEAFDPDIDLTQPAGATAFMVLSALEVAIDGLAGDVTPAAVTDALHTMEWMELPGSGGLHFRCNGNAIPESPAQCVRGALLATLGPDGLPAAFEPIGDTEIED